MISRMLSIVLTAGVLATGLTACASLGDGDPKDWSETKLYEEAHDALQDGDYQQAITHFETLEARYPFSRHAQQALLESAYAYYRYDEPDSAISTLDRFLKLHPRHEYADYALYLKGLANLNRGRGFLTPLLGRDLATRDPTSLLQAFDDFALLIRQYPDSEYAEDARQRMVYLRNMLAEYEVNIAEYYLKRGAYVAALNRARYIVDHYQGAQSMPRALRLMAQAYTQLGLEDLARDTLRVLEQNFPDAA